MNKSSLLLKNILQNAKTLQLLTMNIKTESIYKVIKMPSWKAWGDTYSFIKRGGGAQALKVRVAEFPWLEVKNISWENVCNQSKSLHDTGLISQLEISKSI